jgi:hypothetical protein
MSTSSTPDSLVFLPKAMKRPTSLSVGVLALQGAFNEHIQLLRKAAAALPDRGGTAAEWTFLEVRTAAELAQCDALIIPGGESTTISLVAARSGLLDHLRDFVKCAALSPPPTTTIAKEKHADKDPKKG